MANKHKRGSIPRPFLRKDGRWTVKITLGYDKGTGKQIQKSLYGATSRECSVKATELLASLNSGTYVEPTKMRLADWLEIWRKQYLNGCKPNTKWTYENYINNHISPALGFVPMQKINPHDVQTFYNDLHEKKGLSATTVKGVHQVLQRALAQAAHNGYITRNPAKGCRLPRGTPSEAKFLDKGLIKSFLAAIKGAPLEDFFFVDLFTGMRKAEIIGLKWDCVDFENGLITIDKQLVQGKRGEGYFFAPPKNDKTRVIKPPAVVMEVLKQIEGMQGELKSICGADWKNEHNLVFTQRDGAHLTFSGVNAQFKRILKKAGISDMRFHELRHTFAVVAIGMGVDPKTVSQHLGHAKTSFTLDKYVHVSKNMMEHSAKAMDDFIDSL